MKTPTAEKPAETADPREPITRTGERFAAACDTFGVMLYRIGVWNYADRQHDVVLLGPGGVSRRDFKRLWREYRYTRYAHGDNPTGPGAGNWEECAEGFIDWLCAGKGFARVVHSGVDFCLEQFPDDEWVEGEDY